MNSPSELRLLTHQIPARDSHLQLACDSSLILGHAEPFIIYNQSVVI